MNLKTKITELHYDKNAKGLLFNLLKFCSLFYGTASRTKNFLYDKGILKPEKLILSLFPSVILPQEVSEKPRL